MEKEYGFQTLNEFILNPFGNGKDDKRLSLEQEYTKIKKQIRVIGYSQVDDDALIHIKIPSDSHQNQYYDVVILFFTDDNSVKNGMTLKNYYVKFFSNSPGFIYKYASLYKKYGFLIDVLYDKLDNDYIDKMPEKSNATFDMYYDKSIYCACRLIQDNSFTLMNKLGIITQHKKNIDKFVKDISSFENIKFGNELKELDKGINRELAKKKNENKNNRKRNSSNVKRAGLTTASNKNISIVKKKTGGGKKSKVVSTKSTIKK